jgi:hypothetical protein
MQPMTDKQMEKVCEMKNECGCGKRGVCTGCPYDQGIGNKCGVWGKV